MPDETLEVTESDRQAVVTAHGSFNEQAAEHIRKAMISCLDRGDRRLVLDMKAVPYINTEGLRMLQDVLQQAEMYEATLSLANANSRVLRTLNMTHMDQRLPIYDSVEEALDRHGS